MSSNEQLIADLADADLRSPSDLAERAAYGVVRGSDGLTQIDVMHDDQTIYDPFERDQTYKED